MAITKIRQLLQPLLENIKTHEPELTKKKLIARKYKIFDKIVETILGAYNKYFANPIFQTVSADDLGSKLRSYVLREAATFLRAQPNYIKMSRNGQKSYLQQFSNIVDSSAVYQTANVMKIIKDYQIPMDPVKLLEKAISSIMMVHFKNQKFFSIRPIPKIINRPQNFVHPQNKVRNDGLSDFEEGDW
mgnify:CR=1 FL=1